MVGQNWLLGQAVFRLQAGTRAWSQTNTYKINNVSSFKLNSGRCIGVTRVVNFFNQPDSKHLVRTESISFSHISFPFRPPALVCLPSLSTHTLAVQPHYQKPETQDHTCMFISSTDGVTASFLSPWLWLSTVNGCEYTSPMGFEKRERSMVLYFKQTPNGNGTKLLSPSSPSSPGTKLSTILCSSSAKALELPPLICYFSILVDDAWQLNRPRIAKGRGIIKHYQ